MKRLAVFLVILLFSSIYSFSLDWKTVDLDLSTFWQYNAQIGTSPAGKYPSVLKFTIGAAGFADWDGQNGGLFFRPGGWFSWNNEDVYTGVARPAPEEAIDAMKVLGLMLDVPFGYAFNVKSWELGVQGGLSFYLRFPLWTVQLGTGEPSDFWSAYYGRAQFLYLNFSFWASFPVAEKMDFMFGLRYYQPVSVFWTAAPAGHGIMVGIFGTVRFGLAKDSGKKSAKQVEKIEPQAEKPAAE